MGRVSGGQAMPGTSLTGKMAGCDTLWIVLGVLSRFQEEMIGYVLDNYGYDASFYLMIAVSIMGVGGTMYLAHRSRTGKSSL